MRDGRSNFPCAARIRPRLNSFSNAAGLAASAFSNAEWPRPVDPFIARPSPRLVCASASSGQQLDRLFQVRHRLIEASHLRQRRPQIDVRAGVIRIGFQRFLELLHRLRQTAASRTSALPRLLCASGIPGTQFQRLPIVLDALVHPAGLHQREAQIVVRRGLRPAPAPAPCPTPPPPPRTGSS